MRTPALLALVISFWSATLADAKPLIGAIKSIPLDANGTVTQEVVKADMGYGGYLKGAKKVAVPLVAVAFESSAQASITNRGRDSTTTKSLESHLLIDDKVLQAIADEVQAIVEKDLAAQGFEVLPHTTVDQEPRWLGITKDVPTGVETKDDFMSGFGGNGIKNRWYTAGNRPLFGIGFTGALSELSPLIRTAREKNYTILCYRFKIQFAEIDAKKGMIFSYVKGKNLLHILSADMAVFTPANTLAALLKLKADLTAGSDYVQEVQDLPAEKASQLGPQMGAILQTLLSGNATTVTTSSNKASGHYAVIANPDRYKADSLLLIKETSRQMAVALRKAQ